jgi:hypothetical protein
MTASVLPAMTKTLFVPGHVLASAMPGNSAAVQVFAVRSPERT